MNLYEFLVYVSVCLKLSNLVCGLVSSLTKREKHTVEMIVFDSRIPSELSDFYKKLQLQCIQAGSAILQVLLQIYIVVVLQVEPQSKQSYLN